MGETVGDEIKTENKKGEIDKLIMTANSLRMKGEYDQALNLLNEAEKIAKELRNDMRKRAMGDISHHKARTLQAMGRYKESLIEIEKAIRLRRKDPIQRVYSMFQRYILKTYAGMKILSKEAKETEKALLAAIVESEDAKQIGDFFQNLAYIEQKYRSVHKAILFYKTAMIFREEANDERGKAMTQARLAECYNQLADKEESQEFKFRALTYGLKALDYFKKVGDPERVKQMQSVFEDLLDYFKKVGDPVRIEQVQSVLEEL